MPEREEHMQIHSESPGHPPEILPPCDPGAASWPLSARWITDDRVRETQRVWSKVYGCPITAEEAVEILMNVRRLFEVLSDTRPKGGAV